MSKSTPTLTQSGLLAVLLQRQRYVSYLAPGAVHTAGTCIPPFGMASPRAWRAFRAPKLLRRFWPTHCES